MFDEVVWDDVRGALGVVVHAVVQGVVAGGRVGHVVETVVVYRVQAAPCRGGGKMISNRIFWVIFKVAKSMGIVS